MAKITDGDKNSTTYMASNHSLTKEFMDDINAVFEKHGLCIVPTYEGLASLHDPMQVMAIDDEMKRFFVNETFVCVEE